MQHCLALLLVKRHLVLRQVGVRPGLSLRGFMKLGFNSADPENGRTVLEADGKILLLFCSKAVIIQSAEIQKVSIGMSFEIPEGYVLNISTSPALYEKAAAIFPASIVLDHTDTETTRIPIKNSGRNPLQIMPGMVIAKGYISKMEEIELYKFGSPTPEEIKAKTKPQKKKDRFEFEVK